MAFVLWPLISLAMDSDEFMRDAHNYFNNREYNAAVIQLKNAILANPENAQARVLLGKIYLKLDDGLSALKELRRARELGAAREEVLEPLGRALLWSERNDEILDEISIEDGDSVPLKINILLLHGQAYFAKGQFEKANDQFSRVLEMQADNSEALLGKARIARQNSDSAGFAEFVEKALSVDPENADAWTLKGELLRESGKYQEAVTAFQKALDIAPDKVQARLAKATAYLALGEPGPALAEINQVQDKYANLYMTQYLKAVGLYMQQQLEPARESLQLALKQKPGHLPSHLLLGTIAYQLGQFNQAEQQLSIYCDKKPDNLQANKLLAATLLKLNQPGKAIEVLERSLPASSNDAQLLSMLGGAYLTIGKTEKGLEYLEQASAMVPDSATLHAQIAMGQLAHGDLEQAISGLQTAIDLDQGLGQADVMLALVYLRQKDYDNAFNTAAALSEKQPDNPIPLNLEGTALLGKGERKAATDAFEAALKLQPDFTPAQLNLAQIDLLENDDAAAETRYKKVLSYDEGNLRALLALANLAERAGNPEQTADWLKQARNHHPDDIEPAVALVNHYLKQDEQQRALDLITGVAVAHPRDPAVLQTLAKVQLSAGKEKDALTTWRSLVEMTPKSPQVNYQLALMELNQKNYGAARSSVQQALALQSDYPAAQFTLGRLDIDAKNFDAALQIANSLKQAHPESGSGYELEGDVYTAQLKFKQASEAYVLAYGKANNAPLARKLFQSYLQADAADAAYQVLRQWLTEDPEDTYSRTLLATSLQKAGSYQEAIKEYLKVLEYDPDNVSALNNVAWLYQEAGNPEGVLYAERAHDLAPDRPEITDTLGWLLVQNGDTNRGLVLLQEARIKAPHIPDIQYHMAVALYKSGRISEARKELDRLLRTGPSFPDRDNAQALRDQIAKQ